MSIFCAAANSAEELAKLQSGLNAPAQAFPYAYLWWFFLGLTALLALSAAVTWARKKRHGQMFRGWASITEPHRVAAILTRAATRQANCSLEIFDHRHSGLYHGRVYEAVPGSAGKPGGLALELSRLPGQGVDFEGLPTQVHLNFRPTPQEEMEHYQFSSRTLSLGYHKEKDWRAARLTVAWPGSLISAQRRDFLRLEPTGDQAMRVKLWLSTAEASPPLFEKTRPLAEGSVLDVSVGGMQLLLPGNPSLPEGRDLALALDLPRSGLELDIPEATLFLLFRPITADVLAASRSPRTVLRGRFSGRYRFDAATKTWRRLAFSPTAFQDLVHWLHAYQRFLLKKEKGLTSAPLERFNAYSAQPPERPAPKE
ncbi:MAG: PilZ domain-containing protein [Candidatus Adiutrix sp.]|jgi:hypothetical protein|nr:PilZ domain-containing protein [Candidatus Adiutrix sp.]